MEPDRCIVHAAEEEMTKMKLQPGFTANAGWAPRDQEPRDAAVRLLRMVTRLQTFGTLFSKWYVDDEEDKYNAVPLNVEAVTTMITDGVGKEDGEPDPRLGYRRQVFTSPTFFGGPRDFDLSVDVSANSKWANNCVCLSTPLFCAPDPAVVTFEIFRGVVLAQAEAFDVTSASAWSRALSGLWATGHGALDLPISWISYIGPPYAHLVTPPSSAIVERRPDGGLLMAATDETFDVDNPKHMAVARDIAAAVAPFNALPRPLGNQTYDANGQPIRG